MRRLALALVPFTLLFSFVSAQGATPIQPGEYGQYQPYQTQATRLAPPAGYRIAYLESLGRHGSRSSTSSSDINAAIATVDRAATKGAVTATTLKADLVSVRSKMASLGYGNLSGQGKAEWRGIGQEVATQYPDFWDYANASSAKIDFKSSSVSRAKSSATNFFYGLEDELGNSFNNTARQTDDAQLHVSASYDSGESSAVSAIRATGATAARAALKEVFKASYVDSLSNSTAINDAMHLWDAYAIAPSMSVENAPSLTHYFDETSAAYLSYINDSEAFYKYGPGKASTNGFRVAVKARDDFFREVDERLHNGGGSIATFRFSHGETLMPFLALLKVGQCGEQESSNFSRSNNPWRGDVCGKMAVNVDWAVYTKAGSPTLVTMRLNGEPVRFASSRSGVSCAGFEVAPMFFDYEKIKTCVPRS